jgi:ubiquitin carboxyl-terminal hydrolase 34
MRYAFNINTMQKEKVNTHFSFPRRLDMSPYMEHNLLGADKLRGKVAHTGMQVCMKNI